MERAPKRRFPGERPPAASRRLSSSSASSAQTARAIAAGSRSGTSRPVSPSRTSSRNPPTSAATTAQPEAIPPAENPALLYAQKPAQRLQLASQRPVAHNDQLRRRQVPEDRRHRLEQVAHALLLRQPADEEEERAANAQRAPQPLVTRIRPEPLCIDSHRNDLDAWAAAAWGAPRTAP